MPTLIFEHPRVAGKVVDLSADVLLARSLSFERSSLFLFVGRNNQLGFAQPTMEITGNFHHKALIPVLQTIEEFGVFAVSLVAGPGTDDDPVGKCLVNLAQRDLLLRLEFDIIGNVVFLRRV